MSGIVEFTKSAASFYSNTRVEQLISLAWFLETHQQRKTFDGECMRNCFEEAGVDPPDMSVYLPRLASKKPPQLVKEKGGYRLTASTRRALDAKLGGDPTVIVVANTLADLPGKMPDLAERDFLREAINFYRVQAYRGAIIMVWNLAYDHLVNWVFAEVARISSMNVGIAKKYPKKGIIVCKREDADHLKESEFIEAARAAELLDKNTAQILREKLGRRNMAADPSRVAITQHSADDMITDLVANLILKLR